MSNKKPRIIAVSFQKGGVGKSAISVNLAAYLAENKGYHRKTKRVLLIDGCRHATSSNYLGVHDATKFGFLDVLKGNCSFDDAIQSTSYISDERSMKFKSFNLDIIPSYDYAGENADKNKVVELPMEKDLLSKAMAKSKSLRKYDYVIIDCTSDIDNYLANAYMVSDYFIITVNPDSESIKKLGITTEQINVLTKTEKEKHILGCVINKYMKSESQNRSVQEFKKANYIDCFDTVIPYYIDYDYALMAEKPINVLHYYYFMADRIHSAFRSFANEVVAKIDKIENEVI